MLLLSFRFVAQDTLQPIFLQVFFLEFVPGAPSHVLGRGFHCPSRAYTATGGPPSPFPDTEFRRARGVSRLNCRILYRSAL